MSLRPATSRCRLTWREFVQSGDGYWRLSLPSYFADLFAAYFPGLMQQTCSGFHSNPREEAKYALFPSLPLREVQRIKGFLDFFGRVVCLGLNKHIASTFTDELDFCLALDFTKPSPKEDRTEAGELEYHAKYQRNFEAIGELQKELVFAAKSLPPDLIRRPRLLTCVPTQPNRDFYLPAHLTRGMVDMLPRSFWDHPEPLVGSTFSDLKPATKRLSMEQKVEYWKALLRSNAIQLSRSVQNCSIIVVDDLYQSGASIWSFARYLKDRGALTVVGLTCVKSLRDTDNW